MGLLDDTWEWAQKILYIPHETREIVAHIQKIIEASELETYWNSLTSVQRKTQIISVEYETRKFKLSGASPDPLARFIQGQLTNWIEYVKQFEGTTPETAQQNLAEISAKCIEIFSVSAAVMARLRSGDRRRGARPCQNRNPETVSGLSRSGIPQPQA